MNRYRVESTTSLREDTSRTEVTSRVSSIYRITIRPHDGVLAATINVDSIRITTPSPSDLPHGNGSDSFRILVSMGKWQVDSSISTEMCTTRHAVLTNRARDLIVPLTTKPLHRDLTWQDSTTTTTCQGPVPVRLKTISTYRVVGSEPNTTTPVLRITRLDSTTAAGTGELEHHHVAITGFGTTKAELTIRLTGGDVQRADAITTFTWSVTSSATTRRITQTTQQKAIAF